MSEGELWRPSAALRHIQARAALLAKIRAFFAKHGVLEVETPLLSRGTVPDPYIYSLSCKLNFLPDRFYLQTSPEFCMKRLLAAGVGPIYQICKAFRDDELGARHNPEFTLLEWYRPGFNHHDLMTEMDQFLQAMLACQAAQRFSYRQLFLDYLNLDPLAATCDDLQQCAGEQGIALNTATDLDKDTWLQLLMGQCIEPRLGLAGHPVFVYDFPATQAALARIQGDLAERFEVYMGGIEIANGFHELCDAQEQATRFQRELAARLAKGYPQVAIDQRFLAALEHGLPPCAGVALGVDRLLMLATASASISEVLAFPIDRA
jgi:lysyl-tRNA synthetase class 2